MGTYLEPGTFNFITPAQHEPITTHRKKKSQSRPGDDLPAKTVSPADPPRGTSRPILNVPAELLVKIIGYGSQRDKLAWMSACRKFVDPAERALWRICGRKRVFKLLSMDEEKREHFVKMISHLHVGDDFSCLSFGLWRCGSQDVQWGVYPDHIPTLPASWFIHPRLRSFTALSCSWVNDAIDDVFPALEQASTLEVLRINHHIDRNTPTAFPRLLKGLQRLKVFEAHYVSSGSLLPHLATMPALENIALGGTLDPGMVQQTLDIPGAFINLEALDITLSLDAATDLLQHLSHLNLKRLRNHLNFVYFDLPNELEQLKQLASLRTFDLWLERQGADGPLPKSFSTDIVELLSHLPLEEFYSILDFHTAELESLSKACPRLRVLRFHSWHDLDALNTGSPPLFPKLEHLVTSNFSLDHPVYSKKCIKTWANKLAVAAPVLAHFTRFGVSIWFNTRGGIRRWLASFYDWEERKSTWIRDFDSHKSKTRKNRKRN
ncbi:hypothetical protein KCU77_g175, partial [Aureobasidium melanogenum]